MGYLLVQAVLVVTLGRLGDMFGRVKIYNLGFVVFTLASIALSLDPLHGGAGALWLIGWRIVQAFGGAMLMANSAAILTDAFPANQRGMALGINQVAAHRRPVHRAARWAACWPRSTGGWCSGSTSRSACSARSGPTEPARGRLDPARPRSTGWATSSSPSGAGSLLAAITYGIQPYGGHPMGWTNPWVLGGLIGGVVLLVAVLLRRDQGRRADVRHAACSASGPSRPATWPACSPRSPAAACSSC